LLLGDGNNRDKVGKLTLSVHKVSKSSFDMNSGTDAPAPASLNLQVHDLRVSLSLSWDSSICVTARLEIARRMERVETAVRLSAESLGWFFGFNWTIISTLPAYY
jgi:hypothetical protein